MFYVHKRLGGRERETDGLGDKFSFIIVGYRWKETE